MTDRNDVEPDIEAPEADVMEQLLGIHEEDDDVRIGEDRLPVEADPADVAEQKELLPGEDDETPIEANPADVAEQRAVIHVHDDDDF